MELSKKILKHASASTRAFVIEIPTVGGGI
jgi:hypothetical protein